MGIVLALRWKKGSVRGRGGRSLTGLCGRRVVQHSPAARPDVKINEVIDPGGVL